MSVFVYTSGMGKKALGVYLRVLRDLQDMTQEDVAARLSTTTRQIRKWEKGAQNPAGTTLVQILDCIHGDMKDIITFVDDDDAASMAAAEGMAKYRFRKLDIKPEIQERINHANALVEAFQIDPARFDRWLGYGIRLHDELSDSD